DGEESSHRAALSGRDGGNAFHPTIRRELLPPSWLDDAHPYSGGARNREGEGQPEIATSWIRFDGRHLLDGIERPAEPGRLLTLAAPHLRPSDGGRNPDLRAGKECPECDVDAVPLPGDRGPVRHEPIVGAPRYTVGIGMEGAAKGAWDPVPNHHLVPV